jgi:lipopolysaccharide biosynthesis glycosyltransferase
MSVSEPRPRDPVVTAAADEAYALPLAVVMGSALDHLDPARRLRIHVLDAGLEPATRARLEAAWRSRGASVAWIEPDIVSLEGLPVGGHISLATYFRIVLPRVLPETLDRTLYLDCDTLVLGDLARLWDEPQGDAPALGVQDPAYPYLDAAQVLPREDPRGSHAAKPIENYEALGLDPALPYVNCGVLVVDLARWRAEDLPKQILECLERNRPFVRFWDQYGINAVLAGRIRIVDHRWNVSVYLGDGGAWEHSLFRPEEFAEIVREPWVVHFLGPNKPWQWGSRLRYADRYRDAMQRIPWTAGERRRYTLASRRLRERRRLAKTLRRLRKRFRSGS